MSNASDTSVLTTREQDGDAAAPNSPSRVACFHCGDPCEGSSITKDDKVFCCQGCLVVHDLLTESGLGHFYDLNRHPGIRVKGEAARERWAFLDDEAVQQKLLDFSDGKTARVTFHVPTIHCVACVWLLENLFQLHQGIGRSQVNFPKRDVSITYARDQIKLSEVVALLASIGYEPALTLGTLEGRKPGSARKRQWLQVGVAGFAFGNIMLLSIPSYLGLDSFSGPFFKTVFGILSLALAVPVVVYSASDYWRSALLSFRQRMLTLDVPIALGLGALYGWSAFEIVTRRGEGYLDSLAGLVFFLLCGRVFQQKTHERLAFDRDFTSFFPLSVVRKTETGEESVALSNLRVGDRVVLRNRELIPADARLIQGTALIDYSFVTGEAEPLPKQPGDHLYAGGQQVGGAIEVETVKAVSQSYLTSLWDHEAFRKQRQDDLNSLTNRYSRRFTVLVLIVAFGALTGWALAGDAGRGLKAFTSVLIVACPCALALAAPFALGTAQRWLARIDAFVRNALVIERMAEVDTIVFDKTGTLTSAQTLGVNFQGAAVWSPGFSRKNAEPAEAGTPSHSPQFTAGGQLDDTEKLWVRSLARHSTHPHSVRIAEALAGDEASLPIEAFTESAGAGITATVDGHRLLLGSRSWLERCGVAVPERTLPSGGTVLLAIDGHWRGVFTLDSALRPEADQLVSRLAEHYELALLSGDNERERERFRNLFGSHASLHFNQSPLDKLGFIEHLQRAGKVVMMVGDGLNDAGALKQSDVGVAVVERVGAFSPASDVILEATRVPRLWRILVFARRSARVVRTAFMISALYNVVGIAIASSGLLSPVICAILMPVSSVSVVLFACGAASWAARRSGI